MQPLRRATDLCGFVLYFTLCHVVGRNMCGVNTLITFTDTRWLRGHCSTQAKVEGILLTAAWLWGRDSSVTSDTLGEPDRTPFYVFLPSAWGFVEL